MSRSGRLVSKLQPSVHWSPACSTFMRSWPLWRRGATIPLSNFGMIGGRFASLVVVPPQVAIVGAGRIAPQVVAHQGQASVRRVLPLSLTFDHRVVTGGEAARFIVALKSDLERT